MTAIHLPLICMTVRLGWSDCHTFASYFQVFQMSPILQVFNQPLRNLAELQIFAMLFRMMGFVYFCSIKFNL